MFYKFGDSSLIGFVDSDFARDLDNKKCAYGISFFFFFELGSSVVACFSKKQPIVTPSSTEAEYVTATSLVDVKQFR